MTMRRIYCKYSFAPFGAANGGIADTRMVHLQVSKQDVVCGHALRLEASLGEVFLELCVDLFAALLVAEFFLGQRTIVLL